MAFLEKMKEYLDKGVEVSKEALSKAGDAVQDFSDKSVTKIEAHQLATRQNKEYVHLGTAVREFFDENPSGSLTADDSRISGIIQEICRLDKEIARREEILKAKSAADGAEHGSAGTAGTEDDSAARKESDETAESQSEAGDGNPLNVDPQDATDAEFTKSE